MVGKMQTDGTAAKFDPKRAKAFAAGAEGKADPAGTAVKDPALHAAWADGVLAEANGTACSVAGGSCTGGAVLTNPPPSPAPRLRTHAELDDYAAGMGLPDGWDGMTVAEKQGWLDENPHSSPA